MRLQSSIHVQIYMYTYIVNNIYMCVCVDTRNIYIYVYIIYYATTWLFFVLLLFYWLFVIILHSGHFERIFSACLRRKTSRLLRIYRTFFRVESFPLCDNVYICARTFKLYSTYVEIILFVWMRDMDARKKIMDLTFRSLTPQNLTKRDLVRRRVFISEIFFSKGENFD